MNMMMKRLAALLAMLALCLSLTACGGDKAGEEEQEITGTAVQVITVERGNIATETTVTGNVMPKRNVPVMPPVSGKVSEVHVKVGDVVEEGDVLFTMDTEDLKDLYSVLIDSYTSTKELLDEQIRQTRQTIENMAVLYEMGAVSKNSLEQAKLGLMQAETTRETTLAQLGADSLMETLDDPNVYATEGGTIATVGVTAGVLTSNTSMGVVISELGQSQAAVSVAESLWSGISVGDEVSVRISSYAEPVVGTVASVSAAISQQNALYPVNIDLPADLDVSMGMFATVTFYTDSRENVVLVPSEAILTDGMEQYVFVVNEDGTAARVTVTTGLIGERETEIVTGLSGGEQLVTVGQSFLSEGSAVRIVEG